MSTRSMSDFAHTMSCERLPQRIAARIARSSRICSTSASSAAVNRRCSVSFLVPALGSLPGAPLDLLTTELTEGTEMKKSSGGERVTASTCSVSSVPSVVKYGLRLPKHGYRTHSHGSRGRNCCRKERSDQHEHWPRRERQWIAHRHPV